MVDTVDEARPDPPGRLHRTTWADRVRLVLRGVGQALITAGVVVLLFVVYEVYVTNYFAHAAQSKVKTAVTQQWRSTARDPLLALPGQRAPAPPEGNGIAFLYIPRLGRDYGWAIVEGTSDADLEKGPGHYRGTALPGHLGNFAVAGHRVGKGEPFLNLDHLRAGDAVIVETESKWFVYRVKGRGPNGVAVPDADGVPGREIVGTTDSDVLASYPDHPGQAPTEALMTMTTCHPKFTAARRMVIHAALTKTLPASGRTMPAAVLALYDNGES
jgi:sortase A